MIDVIIKTRTVIGKGELQNIPGFLSDNGYKKYGFIIDQAFRSNEDVAKLIDELKERGLHTVTYYYDLPFEPDYESLDIIKYHFKDRNNNSSLVDVIIAIGGGSVIDFAKGIATLINNHDVATTYKGFPKNLNPSIPIVAVPTTAGTASEVTFNAVFTDSKLGRKLGINTHNNFPVLAILDSNMTKNCPYSIALSSGLDALVHGFESFACKKSNYYTRLFAKQGIIYLLNNIEQALKEVENDQAREKMQFGAYLAGISLFNAGSGPAGALSYPLGVVCKVPHGIAGGFILPYLLEFNVKNGYYGYFEIADELAIQGENEREKCEKLVAYLFDLYDRLDVWALAKKYDIKTNNSALSEYIDLLQGAFDQNPVNFTPSDGKTILNKIF
jgi:alcohol dehydrogenase class IV